MIESFTVRDLLAVQAVSRHLHFGKASAAIGISQPSLSASIKKVEALLGYDVFRRNSRTVAVTPRGMRFVQRANHIIDLLSEFEQPFEEEPTDSLTGLLRIGAIPTVGHAVLRKLLATLSEQFPSLDLVFQEGKTSELLDALRHDALDGVLMMPVPASIGLASRPLFEEELVVVAHRNHAILSRSSLSPADLDPSEMVLLESGHCLTDQTLQLCGSAATTDATVHAAGVHLATTMVLLKRAYTVLPENSLDGVGSELVMRRFDAPPPKRTISMFWNRDNPNSNLSSRFADVACALFRGKSFPN